jgi:hypothetical protein
MFNPRNRNAREKCLQQYRVLQSTIQKQVTMVGFSVVSKVVADSCSRTSQHCRPHLQCRSFPEISNGPPAFALVERGWLF